MGIYLSKDSGLNRSYDGCETVDLGNGKQSPVRPPSRIGRWARNNSSLRERVVDEKV